MLPWSETTALKNVAPAKFKQLLNRRIVSDIHDDLCRLKTVRSMCLLMQPPNSRWWRAQTRKNFHWTRSKIHIEIPHYVKWHKPPADTTEHTKAVFGPIEQFSATHLVRYAIPYFGPIYTPNNTQLETSCNLAQTKILYCHADLVGITQLTSQPHVYSLSVASCREILPPSVLNHKQPKVCLSLSYQLTHQETTSANQTFRNAVIVLDMF